MGASRSRFIQPAASSRSDALYYAVLAIFLVRASLDTVLEQVPLTSGDHPLTVGAAFNVVFLAITFILFVRPAREVTLPSQVWWTAFLLFAAVMSLPSSEPMAALRLLLVLASYQCAFMLPFFFIRVSRERKAFLDVILYSSIVPSVVATYQIIHNAGDANFRMDATFPHPNIFAFYLLVVGSVIAHRLASRIWTDSFAKRCLLIGYSALLAVFLYYTKTRSAWLGATLLLSTYALFVDRRCLLILLLLPALPFAVPGLQERLLDVSTTREYIGNGVILNSYDWRLQLWHDAGTWIVQSPILGHGGLETFPKYSPQFFSVDRSPWHAHSVFIQLAFEIGIIGAILYLAIFVHLMFISARNYRTDRSVSVIGVTLCVAYLSLSYSDNMLYYLSFNWYFFMLLGVLLAPISGIRKMPRHISTHHYNQLQAYPVRGRAATLR